MNLYLDDDSAAVLLVRLLTADGHNVAVPDPLGHRGWADPAHFLWAVQNGRVLLTGNHKDFEPLHLLIVGTGGHHPGVLVVRNDNDPKRDLDAKGIVRALRKLVKSGALGRRHAQHPQPLALTTRPSLQPAIRIIRIVHLQRLPRQLQRLAPYPP